MKHNYGLTHGLIAFAIMYYISMFATFPAATIAGGALSIYYYNREKKARTRDGTPKFKDWYLDSKLDALVPIIVTIVFTLFQFYS